MGSEPLDELSRAVADFLFHNVVLQDDPALVNGGPDGPVIEIEAKLGQLVEKDTNQRLKIPVLTETVFAWPGIGRLMFEALAQRDYAVLLGVFFVSSAMVVIFNLITDIAYLIVDPRIEASA